MITSQFVLGGSKGVYPIYDFSLEDNYDRPSALTVKTDPNLSDSLSNETFMQFYYLDNKLFEGIPLHGRENNGTFELTLYDKTASLWTVGGFAISDSNANISYQNVSAYSIASDVLKGSQFHVSTSSVPATLISIAGDWKTKTDFFYEMAKQIIDSTGSTCTVWIDDNNYVWIGGLNASKTIDLSTKIVNATNLDMNFTRYGGAIVQGGIATDGHKVMGNSMNDVNYANYNITNRGIGNFNVIHSPDGSSARIAFNTVGSHKEVTLGFDKPSSASAGLWWGDPLVNDVRSGNYYTNEVFLRDVDAFFDFSELDLTYKIHFDSYGSSQIDAYTPTTYIESSYPKHAGYPYTYLKGGSMGFMDANNNPIVELTIEKYAAGIYTYAAAQYSTTPYTISDIGKFRIYLNMNNYTKSVKFPNPGQAGTTPTTPNPFEIPYWYNKDYDFLVRFKSRASGWSIQVIMQTAGTSPGSVWYELTEDANNFNITNKWKIGGSESWTKASPTAWGSPPTPTVNYLFNGSNLYPDGTAALDVNGGGYPFMRAYVKTNLDKAITNDSVTISPVYGTATVLPMVVGMPLATVAHKPYLFYSDASIKYDSQAKAIAQNIFTDYQKVLSADIDIDPMTFYYPTNSADRFGVGWNVHLDAPSSITGDYKIRAITATPDRVTVSLKNRSLALGDIIDKVQKQIKDVV